MQEYHHNAISIEYNQMMTDRGTVRQYPSIEMLSHIKKSFELIGQKLWDANGLGM